MLSLHLGCGNFRIAGWTNIDRRYQPAVDLVANIGLLREFSPGSCERIYACHCLDHFTRWEYPAVLKRWSELLAPGGVLMLSVPDFEKTARRYLRTGELRELIGSLVARQDYPDNVRHMHWDFRSLQLDLLEAGLQDVRRAEWEFQDCSKANLDGELMSLNVEATK